METLKSRIHQEGEKQYLELLLPNGTARIPLTEDKPQNVKDVFNKLILLLKSRSCQFEFEKGCDDLYCQIGEEYIRQLNSELKIIRDELVDYDLAEKDHE